MPTLDFWMNAFIPKTVTGYTKTVPMGKHTGKTAVPLPGIARLWPGNLFKDLDAGYLTDQRGFDNRPAASSRMHCWAQVDLDKLDLVKQSHTSSGTTEVNLSSGVETDFAYADMSRCFFKVKPSSTPSGAGGAIFGAARGGSTFPKPISTAGVNVELVAMAGDPLVGMAADIDFEGLFMIATDPGRTRVEIRFNGLIDAFPAYDCYAAFNGATKNIFGANPPPGNTVANLLGGASRPVSGSASFP